MQPRLRHAVKKQSKEEHTTKCYRGRNPRWDGGQWSSLEVVEVDDCVFLAVFLCSLHQLHQQSPQLPASLLFPPSLAVRNPHPSTSSSPEWNPGHILSGAVRIHQDRQLFALTPLPCNGALVKLVIIERGHWAPRLQINEVCTGPELWVLQGSSGFAELRDRESFS